MIVAYGLILPAHDLLRCFACDQAKLGRAGVGTKCKATAINGSFRFGQPQTRLPVSVVNKQKYLLCSLTPKTPRFYEGCRDCSSSFLYEAKQVLLCVET